MNIDILINFINEYGLPLSLSVIFIWFYKQSNEKQIAFLTSLVRKEDEKFNEIDTLKKSIEKLQESIDRLSTKVYSLERSLIDHILGRSE